MKVCMGIKLLDKSSFCMHQFDIISICQYAMLLVGKIFFFLEFPIFIIQSVQVH
jgi:hypothetical protein